MHTTGSISAVLSSRLGEIRVMGMELCDKAQGADKDVLVSYVTSKSRPNVLQRRAAEAGQGPKITYNSRFRFVICLDSPDVWIKRIVIALPMSKPYAGIKMNDSYD